MTKEKIKNENKIEKKRFYMSDKNQKSVQAYLMISTQLLGFFVFTLYPILWAFKKAFYYYNGEPLTTRFVGLYNFFNVFMTDGEYWKTWITTFKFAVYKLPIELSLALITAYLLSRKLKGRNFFRTMFYLPSVVSVAIVGLIFCNMFDYFGIINGFIMRLGLSKEPIEWFANHTTAMAALITGSIWSTFGVNVLYCLAAFQNIPEELYEAAYIEGASKLTVFFKITIPLIAPVFQIIILLAINGSLQTNDYILVTTNGAPGGTTFTVMAYQVSKFIPGFAESSVNIGYGCAMSIVSSAIMCAIAVFYSKMSHKMSQLY